MNKTINILLSVVSFLITLTSTLIIGYYELYTYEMFMIIISILSVINLLIIIFTSSKDAEDIYNKKLKIILKTYDAILSRVEKLPEIEKSRIIIIDNFDDLVDAQNEIKKPICYKKRSDSCSFVLLDDKETYGYSIKMNKDSISDLDVILTLKKAKNANNPKSKKNNNNKSNNIW